jgi:hypothetical protein
VGKGAHVQEAGVQWRSLRIEETHSHARGASCDVVVGIVRWSIRVYQFGGTPRTQTGTRNALTEFAPSYKRATVTQVSLAILGFLSALIAWRSRSDTRWLIGGGLLVSVIPFTALVILPTNKKLLDPAMANDVDLAEKLLTRWGRLHSVRSALSLASLLVFLSLLAKRKAYSGGQFD